MVQENKSLHQLKNLPLEKKIKTPLVYLKKTEIEAKGAISLLYCREKNAHLGDLDAEFVGMAVLQEDSKWILHICPGGGNREFSKDEFFKMMPSVIQELQHQNIQLSSFVIDGRHPEDTLKNFEAWQKES